MMAKFFCLKPRSLLFFCVFLIAPLLSQEKKINIAILPFETAAAVPSEDISERLTRLIEAGLVQSQRFNIIEREQLEALMKEQGLSLSGFVEGTIEPGKIKGVDGILTGKVTNITIVPEKENIFFTVKIKVKVEASVKLIDVQSGQVKLAEVQHGYEQNSISTGDFTTFPSDEAINQETEALLEKATAECAGAILGRISSVYPLEGKILKIEGKKVWINIGAPRGLAPKQKLYVFALKDVLKDPDTGEVIDAVKEFVGEIEVTRVDEKYSEAQIKKVEKGKEIKVGDLVVTQ